MQIDGEAQVHHLVVMRHALDPVRLADLTPEARKAERRLRKAERALAPQGKLRTVKRLLVTPPSPDGETAHKRQLEPPLPTSRSPPDPEPASRDKHFPRYLIR
jgi:hypothetical protein